MYFECWLFLVLVLVIDDNNDEEPGGGVVLLVLGSRDVEYVLGTEMSETQNRTNCIHLSYIFRASINLEVTKNMKLSPFQQLN